MSGTGSATATAALALADGTVFRGRGLGAHGEAVGEVCFNTAMSGYQEILTDPSYAGQIVTFTFPHIGNVGTNDDDQEAGTPAALGLVLRADVTEPSNWRAAQHLERWLERRGLVGIAGIDTRRLTRLLRSGGAQDGALVHTARPEAIDEAALSRELFTANIPDPDLVIRTSGEQRISNFLLWQCAYSELVFLDTLWPDFSREDFVSAVREFHRRERRFGTTRVG
jgi:carbamoyl-phosphate synthase small subunit